MYVNISIMIKVKVKDAKPKPKSMNIIRLFKYPPNIGKHCDAPKNKPKFGVPICTKDHLDKGPRIKTLRTNLKQIEPS
jgi:hypothetical protein